MAVLQPFALAASYDLVTDTRSSGDGHAHHQTRFGGGKGDDVFYGGKGRDSAAPSDGHDTIYFGAGRDYMEMFENDGQRDLIDCGPGKDRIAYLGSRDRHDVLRGCEVVRAYPSD